MSDDQTDGYSPIGVWWAEGVEYTDYRLKNGTIVSVESGEA
jgi:hypothetical protein